MAKSTKFRRFTSDFVSVYRFYKQCYHSFFLVSVLSKIDEKIEHIKKENNIIHISEFNQIILNSKTILWNGPLGVFEMSNFQKGTKQTALSIAKATKNGAFSLVGGGDSISAIKLFGMEDKFTYISTGGGAMLESIEGKVLPGIEAILN